MLYMWIIQAADDVHVISVMSQLLLFKLLLVDIKIIACDLQRNYRNDRYWTLHMLHIPNSMTFAIW